MNVEGLDIELRDQTERFRKIEAESETLRAAPNGAYLVVRADGVKASKRHLKDVMENRKFTDAISRAVVTCGVLWRSWAPNGAPPYLCGAVQFGDEVSFVIGPGPNHFERRLLKMTTTLASTLSAAATAAFAQRTAGGHPEIVAFDGRPLVLGGSAAVHDYIRCRWLCAIRLVINKILRIRRVLSEQEQYGSDKLFDSIERTNAHLVRAGLANEVPKACADFRLHAPGDSGNFRSTAISARLCGPHEFGAQLPGLRL